MSDRIQDIGAARAGERRQQNGRDFEDCVEWVVRYLVSLKFRERPSQRDYRNWVRTQTAHPGRQSSDAATAAGYEFATRPGRIRARG